MEGAPVAALSLGDAILFQLVLRGPLAAPDLTTATDGSFGDVAAELARLEELGLVTRQTARGAECVVVSTIGRDHASSVVAAEGASLRAFVAPLDAEFARLNRRVKEILLRWQVRVDRSTEVPNDHSDARYDQHVLADLRAAHQAADRLLGRLEPLRARYASLRRRLHATLLRAVAGERGAVAGVSTESFHGVWWELHADLLAVLGRARGEADA